MMTTIQSFIKRRPVLTYFTLAFAISWGVFLLVIGGPGKILVTREQAMLLLPVALLAMLIGPSIAGILLTGLVDGRAGYHELLSRLLRWRVGARWYAMTLLIAPLLALATLFALLPTSPAFLPGIFATDDWASLLLFGIAGGLVVGIFEELGWTGFALPELKRRYSVLTTGLILGVLWGAWHSLLAFWGSGDSSGAFSLPLFLPEFLFYIAVLPVYRVLMVWVYDRTGSLLVAMLMHASLTASVPMILMPLAISGMALSTWYLILTAVLWVIVAAVAVANGGQLSRQPSPRQVAGNARSLGAGPLGGNDATHRRATMVSVAASRDEQQRPMLGDELVQEPMFTVTHAVTIDTPPERIWPWLSQLGSLRGGWYSYDWVDNGGRPSADRILEEYQPIAPGDIVPCLPGAREAFVVAAVAPPHDLILIVPGADGPITSWEHLVKPLGPTRSRLIVRGRVAHGWKQMAREARTAGQRTALIEYVYRLIGRLPDSWLIAVATVGHRWMEARHLRGIKWRAESWGRAA
jgi:membrane protease YdiL (CAAX protease family)